MAIIRISQGNTLLSEVVMLHKDAVQARNAFLETKTEGVSIAIEHGASELITVLKEEETSSLERLLILSILRDRGFLATREVFIEGVSSDVLLNCSKTEAIAS
jgi:hypothetical protein